MGTSPNKATYYLVHLARGADAAAVRRRLDTTLVDAEALTPDEVRIGSGAFCLIRKGAGAALFAGALLGMIVGTVIVAQTLYSSTKDHINEFATLRAIGSSGMYIHKVIIFQALLSAVIGFGIASGIGWIIVKRRQLALPVVMTRRSSQACSSSRSPCASCRPSRPSFRVMRIDPAMVFTR